MLLFVIASLVFPELLTRAYIDVCFSYEYVCIMDCLQDCVYDKNDFDFYAL